MRKGIAPTLLRRQVEQTAGWALLGPEASWRRRLAGAEALETRWRGESARAEYLGLLLSAHFATVATFVPTDVDVHIRFHLWQECETKEALRALIDVLDETDAWDASEVSTRIVSVGNDAVSGHEGEWLGVRAGALGRALALGDDAQVDALTTRLDAALARYAGLLGQILGAKGREVTALTLLPTIAHNLGDLSRVVEAWPNIGAPNAAAVAKKYVRLGHDDAGRYGGVFVRVGHLNKKLTATENDRFLVLREPRALRKARSLLLPIGPFFDGWGETIATSAELTDADRGEVLAALLAGVDAHPGRDGYLRAIAGLHRRARGGIDRLTEYLPARWRKAIKGGPVREALSITEERFCARMANRLEQALKAAQP